MGHAAAAVARVPVVRPEVVVVSSALHEDDRADVAKAAALVGAEVLVARSDDAELPATLASILNR